MSVTKPIIVVKQKPIISIIPASAVAMIYCSALSILLISGRVSLTLPVWLSIVTIGCVGSAKLVTRVLWTGGHLLFHVRNAHL
jgi:hypothetical protein